MKLSIKIVLVISTLCSVNTFATPLQEKVLQEMMKSVKIESGAKIDKATGVQGAKQMAVMVKLNGYKCDSVTSTLPFVRSVGYHLVCNNYNYRYELADVGGNWKITVKK